MTRVLPALVAIGLLVACPDAREGQPGLGQGDADKTVDIGADGAGDADGSVATDVDAGEADADAVAPDVADDLVAGDADAQTEDVEVFSCASNDDCVPVLQLGPCERPVCSVDGTCSVGTRPNGTACEDGDACTTNDKCQQGACIGGTNTCDCISDTDCADVDDPNLCDGVLTCQAGKCKNDPSTAIACPEPADTCSSSACDPTTGACVTEAAPNGSPCDDADVCTAASTCQAGACTGALPIDCPDGADPCSVAACDPVTGCTFVPAQDGTACDDGDACTAADACDGGACAGKPLACPGGPCLVTSCQPDGGCAASPAPDGTACDDGDPCTAPDACSGGQCNGLPVCPCSGKGQCPVTGECSDYECVAGACALETTECPANPNPCKVAACSAVTGQCALSNAPEGTPCDAGPCAGKGLCDSGTCQAAAKPCDDGNPCTADSCDDATGDCIHAPTDGASCDDGEPCTLGDACVGAACEGAPNPCDDGDACTTDSCTPGVGCLNDDDVPPCDDGDPCTTDVCTPGLGCQYLPKLCFDPPTDCTIAACNPASGQCEPKPKNQGGACDDGDPCTAGEVCDAGTCGGGQPVEDCP